MVRILGDVNMKCPNRCGELSYARNKQVEFNNGENEIDIAIFIRWCPMCEMIEYIKED